jgi:disulfide bond formation protein DsbB
MRHTLDHATSLGGRWVLAIGGVCALAIALALVLQFGFGLAPCNLCLWERWPYLVAVAAAVGAVIVDAPRAALAAIALVLLGGTVLAAYHVGVKQGLFALPEGCVAAERAQSLDELRQMLVEAPPRCDQVNAQLLGFSLAAWNLALSAALTCAALLGFWWTRPARG